MAIQYDKSRRNIIFAALILVVIVATAAFFIFRSSESVTYQTAEMPRLNAEGQLVFPSDSLLSEVRTVTLVSRPSFRNTEVPGDVIAPIGKTLPIYLPFTARVQSIDVTTGQEVEAGQPLAHIQSPTIALYWGDWLKARSSIVMAQKDFERTQSLIAAGAKSKKELQFAEMTFRKAEAEGLRAKAQLLAVGLPEEDLYKASIDLGNVSFVLRAPFNGKVGDINAGLNENLNDLNVPIFNIIPAGELWIDAQVPQSVAHSFSATNRPTASVKGTSCKGILISEEPAVDPLTRRRSFYLPCEDTQLHVNDFVVVDVHAPEGNALLIPKSALVMSNDDMFVFVEETRLHFSRRKVKVLYDENDNVRVISGVGAGDKVVSSGAVILNNYYIQ